MSPLPTVLKKTSLDIRIGKHRMIRYNLPGASSYHIHVDNSGCIRVSGSVGTFGRGNHWSTPTSFRPVHGVCGWGGSYRRYRRVSLRRIDTESKSCQICAENMRAEHAEVRRKAQTALLDLFCLKRRRFTSSILYYTGHPPQICLRTTLRIYVRASR